MKERTVIDVLTDLSIFSKIYSQRDGWELRSRSSDLYTTNRGLKLYSKYLDFDIRKYLLKRKNKQEKFVVLDLGCGSGFFLSEIELLASNIFGFGITYKLYRSFSRY